MDSSERQDENQDINSSTSSISSQLTNDTVVKDDHHNEKYISFKYATTNARSISAKLQDVIENFENLDIAFLAVTETWLTKSREDQECMKYINQSNGLHFINKNRPTKGGGVSIIYNSAVINLSRLSLNGSANYEIVAALGRLKKKGRKICVICVYLPPKMKAETFKALTECVVENIKRIKREHDPYFVITGDMNKKPFFDELVTFPELKNIDVGATRKGASLDLVITDIPHTSTEVRPPLEDADGRKSDHAVVLCEARTPDRHFFTTETFTVRKTLPDRENKFGRLILATDWSCVRKATPTESAVAFDKIIQSYYNTAYPTTTITKKSTDLPWINEKYRRMVKKKKRFYRRVGKTRRWKNICSETTRLLRSNKISFLDRVYKRVTDTKNTKSFFSAVKMLRTYEAPKQWSTRDMFQDETDSEISERAADYFNQISAEFTPLQRRERPADLPANPPLRHQIAGRLRSFKKPKSQVPGDILPSLFTTYADVLSEPLQVIFEQIYKTWEWPDLWKSETVTLIPKKKSPETLSDLRNLSCTPLVSKLLESFIMDDIKKTIKLSDNQYGGRKGTSVDNFLIDTWQTVLQDLEDHRASSSLISVDFSKAFNRVDHQKCLEKLEEMGASAETVGLVAAFLYQRTMRVRIGKTYSSAKLVNGGAPQGCVIGGMLF